MRLTLVDDIFNLEDIGALDAPPTTTTSQPASIPRPLFKVPNGILVPDEANLIAVMMQLDGCARDQMFTTYFPLSVKLIKQIVGLEPMHSSTPEFISLLMDIWMDQRRLMSVALAPSTIPSTLPSVVPPIAPIMPMPIPMPMPPLPAPPVPAPVSAPIYIPH